MRRNDTQPAVFKSVSPWVAIDRECAQCGATFSVKPSWLGRGFYCSQRCYGLSKRTKVARTCEQCGASVMVKPSTLAVRGFRYCSRACSAQGQTLTNTAERLWARVDKDGPVPEHRPELGKCWLWTGSLSREGYGKMGLNGKPTLTHRIAWEVTNGPIPDGLWMLHACDNPTCLRPEHLFLGSRQDNLDDAVAKGRMDQKLTAAQRTEIVERYARGEGSHRTLAAEYGVTYGMIASLVRRGRREV